MKKLFFLFGFVVMMSFSSVAQDFYRSEDAIDNLKEARVELVSTQSMSATKSGTISLDKVKSSAVRQLIDAVIANGNNQQTLDSVLNSDRMVQVMSVIGDAKEQEVVAYLEGLLIKS